MLIISLATHEIGNGKDKLWLIAVTYFNYATGDGVVVPMTFDTPQDRDDSFDLLTKIAKLQGGSEVNPNNPFSQN